MMQNYRPPNPATFAKRITSFLSRILCAVAVLFPAAGTFRRRAQPDRDVFIRTGRVWTVLQLTKKARPIGRAFRRGEAEYS
jgi:hypothetical protein